MTTPPDPDPAATTGPGPDPTPDAAPAGTGDLAPAGTGDSTRPPAALATDLREVRTRPERAFNMGAALGLLLATATFIFLVQNRGSTRFHWLWFDFHLPLWIALVAALVIGAVLVVTAFAVHRRRRHRIARREQAASRLEDALVGERPARPSPRGPMQS